MKFEFVSIWLLIFFISYFKHVNCIECYQCHSNKQKKCAENINPDYLLECNISSVATGCRKITQTSYFMGKKQTDTIRECCGEQTKECYSEVMSDVWTYTCECEGNGCNSAPNRTTPNRWMLLILVLAAIFPP